MTYSGRAQDTGWETLNAMLIAMTITAGFFLHFVVIYYLPHMLMLIAFYQMKQTYKTPVNAFFHTGTPTSDLRNVPKPDPNLLYSLLTYDISKHPVRFTAPIPDCSWSISLYASNGNNFYATNDLNYGGRFFDMTLMDGRCDTDPIHDRDKIVSPTAKGMAIIRISVMGHKEPEELSRIQRKARCFPSDMPLNRWRKPIRAIQH